MSYKMNLSPTIRYCLLNKIWLAIIGLILLIASVVIYKLLALVSLLFLGGYIWNYIYNLNIIYIVDEEIIIIKKGIISRRYDTIELFRIKDFQIKQSILERGLNLMTITLYSKDITFPRLEMKGLTHDLKIMYEIRGRVQIARKKNAIFEFS